MQTQILYQEGGQIVIIQTANSILYFSFIAETEANRYFMIFEQKQVLSFNKASLYQIQEFLRNEKI